MKNTIRYLQDVAEILGKGHERQKKGNQASYSLSWYFNECLERDLDPSSPTYSELLDAYLHLNGGPTLRPAAPESRMVKNEDYLLDTAFPQSDNRPNERQRMAVHMALHNPVTVVVGPPGTGKTETIVWILAMAVHKGESVAFVSPNHEAIDNVVAKVKKYAKGSSRGFDLAQQLAQRFVCLGNAKDRSLTSRYADGTALSVQFKSGKGFWSGQGTMGLGAISFASGVLQGGSEGISLHYEYGPLSQKVLRGW